jgi:hypothetical protein
MRQKVRVSVDIKITINAAFVTALTGLIALLMK